MVGTWGRPWRILRVCNRCVLQGLPVPGWLCSRRKVGLEVLGATAEKPRGCQDYSAHASPSVWKGSRGGGVGGGRVWEKLLWVE